MRACLFLSAFLSALPLVAQTKHPFTFEDMMALKRVEEPEVSPDGKWVLFAAVDVDLKANTKTPHVWVVPLSSNSEKSGVAHASPVLASVGFNSTADPSTSQKNSQANHSASLGMTGGRVAHASPVLASMGFNSTADPSTSQKNSQANHSASLGMTGGRVAHASPVLASMGFNSIADPSTSQKNSQANSFASLGMTGGGVAHASTVLASVGERAIISDQDADRPRWAPDGKHFAFVSTKENGSQIWIADFDGATGTVTGTHRLTNIPTEADGELWSPDGKNILFKSDVYPECTGTSSDELTCNGKKVQEAKNSKVKAQIFTHLLYRHWNAYKEGKRTHLFVIGVRISPDGSLAYPGAGSIGTGHDLNDLLAIVPRDLTPGDYDAPVFSLGGQDDYAFSPDGKEICYASNHDPEQAISTNKDLFTVPVNFPWDASSAQVLATTKNITVDNKAADETPLYSPDGKYIAYRAQARPGYESDRWRLMLYERKTGAKRDLTETFDRWTGTFTWAPDSSRLFFAAEDAGEQPTYDVAVAEPQQDRPVGETPLVWGSNDDLAITRDGKTIVFTRQSLFFPSEVFAAQLEHLPVKIDFCGFGTCPIGISQLTHINAATLSQISMSLFDTSKLPKDQNVVPDARQLDDASTTSRFEFIGAHSDKVEGFLVKPPNFDPSKKYPVKFLIHGGPEGAWGDDWSYRWNPELFAANGYVVIMINFHGSTGYGQKFIDAINGDWGGAPFEDLMKGLDYAEEHYPFIDKDRECALGASYGGYMANWILGHTERFKCIVTHDGMFNPFSAWGTTEELWFNEWEFKGTPYTNHDMYNKWSPRNSSPNFKTPTLVIHSQLDYRLDVSEGLQLFTTLQREGVPSKMLYFPDEGHWVLKPQNSQLWYKTVNDWVDQWVGK